MSSGASLPPLLMESRDLGHGPVGLRGRVFADANHVAFAAVLEMVEQQPAEKYGSPPKEGAGMRLVNRSRLSHGAYSCQNS